MIYTTYNLSDRYENTELGLIYNTYYEKGLLKAEDLDFKRITNIYPFNSEFLVLNAEGEVYHFDRKIKGLEGNKIIDVVVSLDLSFVFFISSNQEVYAWGWNSRGQLGLGDYKNREIPEQIKLPDNQKIAYISGGYCHTLALTDKGNVYAWGSNTAGKLGIGKTDDFPSPQLVEALANECIKEVEAGWHHSLALTKTGKAYSWGDNSLGQLGHGHSSNINTPLFIAPLNGEVAQISIGANHCLALMKDRAVYSWGSNWAGQLGTGTTDKSSPTLINSLNIKKIRQIVSGFDHCFALSEDKRVYAWGLNAQGQLGLSDYENRFQPTIVKNLRFESLF